MTILATVDPANAEAQAKSLLDAVHKKLGVVPNMMRVLATNPVVLAAYLGFAGTLGGGHLGARLHEQIALTVAEANGCAYCLAAHTALGQGAGLAMNEILGARGASASDPRSVAALRFARSLVTQHGRVSAAEVAQARASALSDADLIEIIAAVAINQFTNYVNLTADTAIDFPPVEKLINVA